MRRWKEEMKELVERRGSNFRESAKQSIMGDGEVLRMCESLEYKVVLNGVSDILK